MNCLWLISNCNLEIINVNNKCILKTNISSSNKILFQPVEPKLKVVGTVCDGKL